MLLTRWVILEDQKVRQRPRRLQWCGGLLQEDFPYLCWHLQILVSQGKVSIREPQWFRLVFPQIQYAWQETFLKYYRPAFHSSKCEHRYGWPRVEQHERTKQVWAIWAVRQDCQKQILRLKCLQNVHRSHLDTYREECDAILWLQAVARVERIGDLVSWSQWHFAGEPWEFKKHLQKKYKVS